MLGNCFWTPGRGINKHPFRFALGEHSLISDEAIAPQRPDLSPIGNPGQDGYLVVQERRFQVFDAMHPNKPGTAEFPCELRSATSLRVGDGGVLHPLNVSHVVDMAMCIDHLGRDTEPQTKYRIHEQGLYGLSTDRRKQPGFCGVRGSSGHLSKQIEDKEENESSPIPTGPFRRMGQLKEHLTSLGHEQHAVGLAIREVFGTNAVRVAIAEIDAFAGGFGNL